MRASDGGISGGGAGEFNDDGVKEVVAAAKPQTSGSSGEGVGAGVYVLGNGGRFRPVMA